MSHISQTRKTSKGFSVCAFMSKTPMCNKNIYFPVCQYYLFPKYFKHQIFGIRCMEVRDIQNKDKKNEKHQQKEKKTIL